MTSSEDFGRRHHRIDRRRVALYLMAIPAFLVLFLFLPAGSVTWAGGWLFVLVLLPAMAVSALWLWRVNPEIYAARSRIQQGTKRWDRIVIAVMVPVMAAILPVAGLDAGRFRWSVVPRWVCLLGYALLLVGLGIAAWAEAVNRFFELGVRIQAERGHEVIDSGPYAVVRHPGYVATSLLLVGVALALGSFWALIPADLATLLLLVRTRWEDRSLQDELAGYKDYTQRVRFKWIPGIWERHPGRAGQDSGWTPPKPLDIDLLIWRGWDMDLYLVQHGEAKPEDEDPERPLTDRGVETARRVGARRGRRIILTVDAGRMHRGGHGFFLSANGVWLSDAVPPGYLSTV